MKFRIEAVRNAERPFETIERPIPFRVPYAVAGLMLALTLSVFGLWCVFGRISEKVHGLGLIAGEASIEEITSPGDGLVLTLNIRRGDTIHRGQIIGRIYSLEDRLALQTAEQRVEMFRRNRSRAAEESHQPNAEENAAILEYERVYRETLYRSQIIATTGGTVLGTIVAPGDRVKTGDSLVRVQRHGDPGTHVVTAYFSAREARKLAVGMPAIVTPSTVRAERDGSLRGIVTAVGKDIDTRQQMCCQFRNDVFVDRLIEASEDMPVRVQVQFICDLARPGQYEWTGAGGRDINIEPNTVCSVSVAYRRHSPASLAFARLNRTFTGAGVHEEVVIRDTGSNSNRTAP